MMNLDYLNNIEIDVQAPKSANTRSSTPKLPTDADIRVFANGKAYPSEAFAKANGLEYGARVKEGEKLVVVGNGLDIISSLSWGEVQGKLETELIFIAVVPKKSPKVDLWGSTTYDDKGEPKSSVLTQGGGMKVKTELMPLLTTVYAVNWDTSAFVDLKVRTDVAVKSPTNIYHIPKIISGGKFKGEFTYVRRENLTVNPVEVIHTEVKEATTGNLFEGDPAGDAPDTIIDQTMKVEEVGEVVGNGPGPESKVLATEPVKSNPFESNENNESAPETIVEAIADEGSDTDIDTDKAPVEEKKEEDDWAAGLGVGL